MEFSKAAKEFVKDMVATPRLVGVDLDSLAYRDMMDGVRSQEGADFAAKLDTEIRMLLSHIGQHGFSVLSD